MAAIRQKCCHETGFCFMESNHPALEDFDDDLPGKCQYTDIDGMVESCGFFLISEFKKSIDPQIDHIPKGGQRLALERLTKLSPKISVWLIEGDSPRRQCTRMRVLRNGIWGEWESVDWLELKARHARWLEGEKGAHRERHARPAGSSSVWKSAAA